MKKLFAGILAASLTLSLCAVNASASGHGHGCGKNVRPSESRCGNCLDEDCDGICDICEKIIKSKKHCGDFADENNDGICDNNKTHPHGGRHGKHHR